MNKQRVLAVVGVIALALGGLAVWRCGGRSESGAAGSGSGSASTASGDDQLAALRAARGTATPVDVSPATVRGQVIDKASGKPLPGAVVTSNSARMEDTIDDDDDVVPPHATTDASGHFELTGVRPGEIYVGATAADHLPGEVSARVAPHGSTEVTIALETGGQPLTGLVSDVGGGPISGAQVFITRSKRDVKIPAAHLTLTDDTGHYRVLLPDGDQFVGVKAEGYVTAQDRVEIDGAPAVLDFVLTPAASVSGVVLSRKDRAPVANALVSVSGGHASSDRGGFSFGGGQRVHADASGHFKLKAVKSGSLELSASAPGLATVEPVKVDVGVAESLDDVEIVVDRAPSVRGFVVRENKPKEGVPGVLVMGWSMKGHSIGPAMTDSAGAFALDGARSGMYMLFAFKDGETPSALRASATVEKDDVNDVIITMPAGGTLVGRVEPPQVAEITLELPRGKMGLTTIGLMVAASMAKTTSNPDGTFTLSAAPVGELDLVASARDGSTGKLAVKITEGKQEGLVVRLEPRAQVEGQVVDAAGKPVRGAEVALERKEKGGKEAVEVQMDRAQGRGRATADANGRFVIRGLLDGEYEVSVEDSLGDLEPDSGDEFPTITLAKAEKKKGVVLRVESLSGTIGGRVVDDKGSGVADAWVAAKLTPDPDRRSISASSDGNFSFERQTAPALTDASGHFTIARARSGSSYTVSAEKGALRGEVALVKPDTGVTIKLQPLASLSVRVKDTAGKPVTHYDLTVIGPGGDKHTVDDPEGQITLTRIRAGEVSVGVRAKDAATTGKTTLEAGQTGTLELTLAPLGDIRGVFVDARSKKPIGGLMVFAAGKEGASGDELDLTALMTGGGPKSGSDGSFKLGRLSAGRYNLVAVDVGMAMSGASQHVGATTDFVLAPGESKDLGQVLGLGPDLVPPGERGDLGLSTEKKENPERLLVDKVAPGSAAEAAGLKVGDQIIGIDGINQGAASLDVLDGLLESDRVKAGQILELSIVRAGKPLTIKVTAKPEA